MTIFYDPQTKKPKVWTIIAFIVVPIIVILCIFIVGQGQVEKHKQESQAAEPDIFQK